MKYMLSIAILLSLTAYAEDLSSTSTPVVRAPEESVLTDGKYIGFDGSKYYVRDTNVPEQWDICGMTDREYKIDDPDSCIPQKKVPYYTSKNVALTGYEYTETHWLPAIYEISKEQYLEYLRSNKIPQIKNYHWYKTDEQRIQASLNREMEDRIPDYLYNSNKDSILGVIEHMDILEKQGFKFNYGTNVSEQDLIKIKKLAQDLRTKYKNQDLDQELNSLEARVYNFGKKLRNSQKYKKSNHVINN